MKAKIKTIGYTLQPLDRTFAPVQYKSVLHFWYHKINKALEPYVTNGRKYDNIQKMKAFCREFNEQRRTRSVHTAWGNPNPHQDNTQQIINDIKFGRL